MHPQQGGSDALGFRILFKGCDPGGTALRSGYLGGNPPQGKGPWGASDPVVKTTEGKTPTEDNGWDVDINLSGSGNVCGGVLDNGGIHQAAPEHGRTVYCYTITVRPV